jgi:hypothetical protein
MSKRLINVRMEEQQLFRVEEFAERHGLSSAWVIRKAVDEWLSRNAPIEVKGIVREVRRGR